MTPRRVRTHAWAILKIATHARTARLGIPERGYTILVLTPERAFLRGTSFVRGRPTKTVRGDQEYWSGQRARNRFLYADRVTYNRGYIIISTPRAIAEL